MIDYYCNHKYPAIKVNEMSETSKSKDFLRTIIDEDIKTNKYGGNVITRFPPEPNGFPHIGHAKSICLNFGIAKDYGGHCNLRMDDTNPTKEDTKYVEALKNAVRWLGFDWGDNLFFASDYFEQLYEYAIRLIKMGKAYVCSLSEEEIRDYRGTVKKNGKPSPYRERSIEENLQMFEDMRAGKYKDGDHVLRAKIDMTAANMKMRDPLLYRIRHAHHFRTGDNWCIYPMYDFAHCLSDYIEGITHSICTLEFENNRELYDWILDELELDPPRPYQYEFARLGINYTVMSKRFLLELVEDRHVNGWDDPRLPTIAGYKRRGYTPESILKFCDQIGIAKANSTVDMSQLEFCIRDDLNKKVPRVMCVLDPIKVVIENYPEEKVEEIDASYYPHDVPKEGTRKLPFSKTLYIERDDFMETPPKGYFRLTPEQEVRLRHAYIIKCEKVIKDENSKVIEIHASYDPTTKSGSDTSGKKVKGTIHWVSAGHAKQVEIRLYDRLYSIENPSGLEDLNPDSLKIINNAFVEPAVIADKPDERFQFERQGYFYADPVDYTEEKPVFNRIVGLKDSWAKKAEPTKSVPKSLPKQVEHKEGEVAPLTEAEQALFNKYTEELKLNEEVSNILARDEKLSSFFKQAIALHNSPTSVANIIANEVSRELKDKSIDELNFEAKEIAELVEMVDKETISTKIARQVFDEMAKNGGTPSQIIESKGLILISDPAKLEPIVDEIIAKNPDNVKKHKEGRTNLLGFFVGQVLKATNGKANPKIVNELLAKKL